MARRARRSVGGESMVGESGGDGSPPELVGERGRAYASLP